LNSQNAWIDVAYYNSDGSLNSTAAYSIPPKGLINLFPPNNFVGSATIESDRPIAVAVNVVNKATSGDTHGMYNASTR
jgi:hypothetical protein